MAFAFQRPFRSTSGGRQLGISGKSTGKPAPRPNRAAGVGRAVKQNNKRVASTITRKSGGGTGGKTAPRTVVPTKIKTPTNSAPKSPAPPVAGPVAPIVPDINAYLAGDVDYQTQLRQFDKTLADYTADSATKRTRTQTDYGEGKRNMGKQRDDDLVAIKDDFASRGILGSGLYTGRIGEYETDYASQLAELERQYNQSLEDLSNQGLQFGREQELAKEAARQDAIRRRAQQYGV